jgi:hypothetical protein
VESWHYVMHIGLMSGLTFVLLNQGWNAEPNAPALKVDVTGETVTLSFFLNPFAYDAAENEVAYLAFNRCSRWRWDSTNDHAWFSGTGRFSGQAPQWGEFYEILGDDVSMDQFDWEVISADHVEARHFLFYFRDETVEVVAADWVLNRSS